MEHYDWNDGWLFTPVFDPAIVRPECPELTLEPVRLPHTVKALPYNYCNENDYQKLSGYRREFFAPKEWEGRTVLLTFGAVAHDATVFCNGRRVFHHSCGYTAFTVDLTSALHLGQKNVVAVRCDSREDLNIPPFGGQMDFLTYGGICRAVCLDVKEPAYLRDIFIETKAEGDFRIYTATVGETVGCTLQAEIRSPSGSRAFYTGELSLPITGALNSVHPWSIEHPTLYTLTVRLIRPGTGGLPDRVLDEKSCRFGFRTLQFVAGGLYLNGQRVELNVEFRTQHPNIGCESFYNERTPLVMFDIEYRLAGKLYSAEILFEYGWIFDLCSGIELNARTVRKRELQALAVRNLQRVDLLGKHIVGAFLADISPDEQPDGEHGGSLYGNTDYLSPVHGDPTCWTDLFAVQLHHVDLHVHLIRAALEVLRIFGMPPCHLFQLIWGCFAAQSFVYYLLIHYLVIKLYAGFIAFSF